MSCCVTKFNFNSIEQYIQFINYLNRQYEKTSKNQWVIVKWKLENSDITICVINEEHLTIFMNWLIENQEFIWEYNKKMEVKSGLDILNELKFYYHSDPITLHQYYMKKKQKYRNQEFNFCKFIENIAIDRYKIYENETNDYEENIDKEFEEQPSELPEDENETDETYNDDESIRWEQERQILNEYSLEELNKIVNIFHIYKK